MSDHPLWSLSPRIHVDAPEEFAAGWSKQRRAAAEILRRFTEQPGVILADQVGMGKTFTALAVAVSVALGDPAQRPVVVLVPSGVAHKWIGDWSRFARTYLDPDLADAFRDPQAPITRPGEFFSALVEPPATRRQLLVVTHTALSNSAVMQFAEVVVLWAATGGHGPDERGLDIRRRFTRWCGQRTWAVTGRYPFSPETVAALLDTPPAHWKDTWEELTGRTLQWDPVPAAVVDSLQRLDLRQVREALEDTPQRRSSDDERTAERLRQVAGPITTLSRALWRTAMAGVRIDVPLLILDEAHHAKNNATQLAKLFSPRQEGTADGILHQAAERMLFLTATPFELGHDELLRVLSRFSAARADGLPEPFTDETQERLRSALVTARHTSRRLEGSWGRVTAEDLHHFESWTPDGIPDDLPADVRTAWRDAQSAVAARRQMNALVRRWVIRHERPRNREVVDGVRVIPGHETPGSGGDTVGIPIGDEISLPFLLAARIHSLAERGTARPHFAYGIASSFEAYLRWGGDEPDHDAEPGGVTGADPGGTAAALTSELTWYDERVRAAILGESPSGTSLVTARHPKIDATVRRALHHWSRREKVVVFCWFTRTIRAVHSAIDGAIRDEVHSRGARAFGVDPADTAEVKREYDRLAARLLTRESESRTNLTYRAIREELESLLRAEAGRLAHPDLVGWVADAVIRNMRTPEYLARVDGLSRELDARGLLADFHSPGPAGRSLADAWVEFAQRVDSPAGDPELFRDVLGRDLERDVSDDHGESGRGARLEAVRFAYGKTGPETRRRLARVFTTPSAPEVLVAGSVMGEGIDLHTECAVTIHHDMDWNPGIIEQRTGRIERIGSLAERRGQGITVYVPFLAGTHDEKQFRVVRDRQQWFDLVMGSRANTDPGAVDSGHDEEARVPLARSIADAMALTLSVD